MRNFAPAVCLIASITGTVAAQGYSTDFESFTASLAGTPCAGQDGFYVAPVAGSIDGNIHLNGANSLGIGVNPLGGANFYAGVSAGGTSFARAQRALTLPTGKIFIGFDVACNYLGTVTPTQNIGSISFQPSATNAHVNLLARWPTGVTFPPTTWNADYVLGPSPTAGTQTLIPDPAFQGLALGVWHHWTVTVDLVAGVYTEFSITNGVTNVTTTYTPNPPLALPGQGLGAGATDFRFFTGGTAAGNVFAIDNFTITEGAQYTTFGAGCPGALGVPALTGGVLPKLGATMTVDISNLPVNVGIMVSGLSNTLLGGAVPLPLPLASVGFPGCDLLVDSLTTDTFVGAANTATWSLAIPLSNPLLGLSLYNQAASLDTGTAFLAFSNGGRARIGL
jgi:hypothetical protein